MYETFARTKSVCPVCLRTIDAEKAVAGDGFVHLIKTCPEHGFFDAVSYTHLDVYKRQADTEAHAREAAKAVKVDLEVLPAYMSVPEALAPDAIEIHPGTPNAYYETNCIKGPDFDFDSAPNVIEVESYCSRQPHLYLEPDNGYAYIDEDGMLTVHSKSIGIHLHMPMIADGIGVTMDKLLSLIHI